MIKWRNYVGLTGKVSAEPTGDLAFVVCCSGRSNFSIRRNGDGIRRNGFLTSLCPAHTTESKASFRLGKEQTTLKGIEQLLRGKG